MGINNLILADVLSSKSLLFFSWNKGFRKTYTDWIKTSIGIKHNEVYSCEEILKNLNIC